MHAENIQQIIEDDQSWYAEYVDLSMRVVELSNRAAHADELLLQVERLSMAAGDRK